MWAVLQLILFGGTGSASGSSGGASHASSLLLESGDYLLLESGDTILLE